MLLLAVPSLAHAQTYCPPVEVFSAAGSGGSQKPNRVVREAIRDAVGADNVFARTVDYPAVSLGPTNLAGAGLRIGKLGKYHDSVSEGKRWLRRNVRQVIRDCQQGPRTQIVLLGYSQGAQVVGDVYQGLTVAERDRIAGVVLFGDPYFNASSYGNAGNFKRGDNGVLGRRARFRTHLSRIRSYCDRRDYVCQGNYASYIANVRFLRSKAHSQYPDDEAVEAGRWLGKRIKALLDPVAGQTMVINPHGGSDVDWVERYSFKQWLAATGLPMDAQKRIPAALDLAPFRCVALDAGPGPEYSKSEQAIAALAAYMQAGGTVIGLGEWSELNGSGEYRHDLLQSVVHQLGLTMSLSHTNWDPLVVQGRKLFMTPNVMPAPETAGVSSLAYAAFSDVIYWKTATPLVKDDSGYNTIIASQAVGLGRFVLAGDSFYSYDRDSVREASDLDGNRQLVRNLCGSS